MTSALSRAFQRLDALPEICLCHVQRDYLFGVEMTGKRNLMGEKDNFDGWIVKIAIPLYRGVVTPDDEGARPRFYHHTLDIDDQPVFERLFDIHRYPDLPPFVSSVIVVERGEDLARAVNAACERAEWVMTWNKEPTE